MTSSEVCCGLWRPEHGRRASTPTTTDRAGDTGARAVAGAGPSILSMGFVPTGDLSYDDIVDVKITHYILLPAVRIDLRKSHYPYILFTRFGG